MAIKRCGKCKTWKSISLFSKNRSREDGLQDQCKICVKAYYSVPERRAREKIRVLPYRQSPATKERKWETHLKRKFDMTAEEYNDMLQDQDGVCAICFHTCSTGSRLSVDHCHNTLENRGLLCKSCNVGIGNFGDDVVNLRAAIDYLENVGSYSDRGV